MFISKSFSSSTDIQDTNWLWIFKDQEIFSFGNMSSLLKFSVFKMTIFHIFLRYLSIYIQRWPSNNYQDKIMDRWFSDNLDENLDPLSEKHSLNWTEIWKKSIYLGHVRYFCDEFTFSGYWHCYYCIIKIWIRRYFLQNKSIFGIFS